MRKLTFLIMFLVLLIPLMGTITYSTITSQTVNKFALHYGTTTVAVADTAANYIVSPVFTMGDKISSREIIVMGTVVADCKHSVSTAVQKLYCTLEVSGDGTNFATIAIYPVYATSAATAGTVAVVPISLTTMQAPYYRIKWTGYSASGVAYTAKIFGTIKTSIIAPP